MSTEYYLYLNLMIWCDLQLITLNLSLNINQQLVALVLWMLYNFFWIDTATITIMWTRFLKHMKYEDICIIKPVFYMHANHEIQKNTADVSHNIQLSGAYKCLVRWTSWKYRNKKLTWRKTQRQLVITIIFFSFYLWLLSFYYSEGGNRSKTLDHVQGICQ